MSYINNDFLLTTKTAKVLYNDYAKDMPIFDYHCHLPEKQILENKPFNDLFEIWLAGDHYKWRLMRNYGISEQFITGKASNKDKFLAYCKVLGTAFGNPLYHWSQIELQEFFGCEKEINEQNAQAIWEECNAYILENKLTPQKLIESSNVKHLFTTNEVFDDLTTFEKIKEKGYNFTVAPAFRADKIMNIEADGYLNFVFKLSELTFSINNISDLEKALENRLNEFIKVGSKASDIAVERICPVTSQEKANEVFVKVLGGAKPSLQESEIFKGYITYFLMKMYAKYNIATEVHIGAMRNNNTKMLNALGLDTGFDSISDTNSITNLSRLMDKLNLEGCLPKTIIFNLNPKMNSEIMSLIGCFQSDEARGKIQYGPAWWFLDNKVGMEQHLRDLTATGHIAVFVGMLTDSRSLLSYPRHHYFRRILCEYLGGMMENGEMTSDISFVGEVVKDICFNNSVEYFGV
ncbi:MAG: glucuronate isomerase [Acutalibacteraceae bacterium]|nr:glucuronate isomerase [Acutalibacteraceae bacterium]